MRVAHKGNCRHLRKKDMPVHSEYSLGKVCSGPVLKRKVKSITSQPVKAKDVRVSETYIIDALRKKGFGIHHIIRHGIAYEGDRAGSAGTEMTSLRVQNPDKSKNFQKKLLETLAKGHKNFYIQAGSEGGAIPPHHMDVYALTSQAEIDDFANGQLKRPHKPNSAIVIINRFGISG